VQRQGCAVGVAGEQSEGATDGGRLLLKMLKTAGRAAGGGGVEAQHEDLHDWPDRTHGNQIPDPAESDNFHICANNAMCRTVAKQHGLNETQLVLWNEAKNPGLTAMANKLRRG